MKNIELNIKIIKKKILSVKSKHKIKNDITIVAVSKTFPSGDIKKVYDLGIKNIGENRYQEAKPKIDELKNLSIVWHFIGTLQTNKIRKIMDDFHIIQSVSEKKHINKIDSIANEKGVVYPVFIEINIGNETNKSGFSKEEINEVMDILKSKRNIVLKGLMCIPPYSPNPEDSRKYFKEMRILFDNLKKYNNGNSIDIQELSMGMSEDYMIAIKEGATMVRIGRGIFGERD